MNKNLKVIAADGHIVEIADATTASKDLKSWRLVSKNYMVRDITDYITAPDDDITAQIEQLMTACGYYDKIYRDGDNAIVHIKGDWKHDHARFDYYVQLIFNLSREQSIITEPSDSDYYASDHYYKIA